MLGKSIIAGLVVLSILTVAGCGGGSFGFIPDDNTDPTLSVFGISDAEQFGTLVAGPDMPHISAVAADDSGIASLTLKIDGVLVASSNDPNLAYDWDAIAAGNGVHELKWEATDMNGNTADVTYSNEVFNFIFIPFP